MHIGVGDVDNRPLIYGIPLASSTRRDNGGGLSLTDPSVQGGGCYPSSPSPSPSPPPSASPFKKAGDLHRPNFDLLTAPPKSPLFKLEPLGFFSLTLESIKVSLPDVYLFVAMKVGPFWIRTKLQKSSDVMPRWTLDLPIYDPGTTFSMVIFYQKSKTSSDSYPYARRFVQLALAPPNEEVLRTVTLSMLAPDGGPKAKNKHEGKGIDGNKGLPNHGKLVEKKASPWLPWMGEDVDHTCVVNYRFKMRYPSYKRLAKAYADPPKVRRRFSHLFIPSLILLLMTQRQIVSTSWPWTMRIQWSWRGSIGS